MPLLIQDLRLLLKHLFHPAPCPVLWLHQRWIGGDQFLSGLLSLAEQGYVRGKVRHLQLGQAVSPSKEVPRAPQRVLLGNLEAVVGGARGPQVSPGGVAFAGGDRRRSFGCFPAPPGPGAGEAG